MAGQKGSRRAAAERARVRARRNRTGAQRLATPLTDAVAPSGPDTALDGGDPPIAPHEVAITPAPEPPPAAGELGARSAAGVVISVGSQGGRFLINFGSMVILAHLLLPWHFGLIAIVTPIVAFLYAFADLGLAQAVVQRPELNDRELSSVFWLVCIATVLLAVGLAAAGPVLAMFYRDPRLIGITAFIAPAMAVSGAAMVHRALLTREARFRALAVIDIGSALAGAVVAVVAASTGAGYWALVYLGPANIVCATLLCWVFCRWRPKAVFNWRSTTPLVGAGGYVALANFGALLTASIDNILIGAWAGQTALGLYDQGYRLITQSVAQLLGPVSRVMIPMFVRAKREGEDYAPIFLGAVKGLGLALWPGLLVAAAFAPEIVHLILGAKWDAAAPIFAWFCVASLASPLFVGTSWLFLAEGRFRAYAVTSVLGSGAIAAAVLAGLDGGASSVAAAVALAYVGGITPLLCFEATRTGPVRLRAIARSIAPYAAAAAALALGLQLLKRLAPLHDLGLILAGLGLAYAFFIGVALACPTDRRLLRSALETDYLKQIFRT